MKPSHALASLRELASMGLPAKMSQRTVSVLMSEVVPAETFTILWFDEQCGIRDLHSNHLCPREIGKHFITEYLNARESEAYEPHFVFMRSSRSYDLLHRNPSYPNTSFYDEFARPMGFGPIARVAVREGSHPVAAIWMTRGANEKDFSRHDLAYLAEAGCYAEHILTSSASRGESNTLSGENGWLVANDEGVIQYVSAGTEALLHLAADVPRSEATLSTPCYEWALPLLRRLARRVAILESRRRAPTPTLTVINQSGRYTLHASRLQAAAGDGQSLVGVQITRRIPLALRLLESPSVRALPPREKQVCLMLVQGLPTNEIASRMGISINGVVQHVRSLYNRLRIHSRAALLPALTQI